MEEALVAVIMGSDNDLTVMKSATEVLDEFSIPHEVLISSAHRTPEQTIEYASSAANRGIKVIIAAAGMAAHLGGVIAAHTPLPVIGVPIRSGALEGIDALYSTVQMPPGVPVATVGINGAKNAALLAVQIIGTNNNFIQEQILNYKAKMAEQVMAKNTRLQELGIKKYLESKNT